LTATLIDVIPVLIMFGVAYGIAVANPARRCYMYLSPSYDYYEHCYVERSLAGSSAIVIAAVTALAYMAWNWVYRQSRKGATIGESALKIKMLDETGRPPGFTTKRIVGLAIPIVATAIVLLLGTIQLAGWTINSDTNVPSTGWTGTDSS
jgi:uncharacterized RDD family membrane protein YckC